MVRNVYLYAVMLVTLVMMIGGSVAVIMSASDYFVPGPYYDTYESYAQNHAHNVKEGFAEEVSEEDLRARFQLERDTYLDNQRAYAANSMVKSLAWVLIPLPVFLISAGRLRKAKPE
ncbi:hypothetical protein CR205_00355 [Alteribacter lacisalsi]|uniref:DUF4199 domain-containing protein n=1 Tax=Alteribacter lacisalsi TaxID=2045244 RepID=A0A2W0H5H3_9BACI|nr:hypothetical protein [Alteribacter lacisalsi]PYZ97094.1 hypothetical protein CR205_00355 [Alteribacter lacisalsi]